jgi:hypothetical protein
VLTGLSFCNGRTKGGPGLDFGRAAGTWRIAFFTL